MPCPPPGYDPKVYRPAVVAERGLDARVRLCRCVFLWLQPTSSTCSLTTYPSPGTTTVTPLEFPAAPPMCHPYPLSHHHLHLLPSRTSLTAFFITHCANHCAGGGSQTPKKNSQLRSGEVPLCGVFPVASCCLQRMGLIRMVLLHVCSECSQSKFIPLNHALLATRMIFHPSTPSYVSFVQVRYTAEGVVRGNEDCVDGRKWLGVAEIPHGGMW